MKKTEVYFTDDDGYNQTAYLDRDHKQGTRCFICGSQRAPIAGRCADCSYIWYKSAPTIGDGNWHNYSALTYKVGRRY